MNSGLILVDHLLRDRTAILERIEAGEDLGALARTFAITIVAAAAVTGATLGFHRGGLQILYAAIKLPLVLLLTAGVCTPAFHALGRVVHGRADLRRDAATVLASLALGSLLTAATAPLVLLFMQVLGYHAIILLAVVCCGVGGLAGLLFFLRALHRRPAGGRRVVAATLLTLFAVVGCQLTWSLRPYLLRPRTPEVVFVRALDGSFLQAVSGSVDSARGVYHRRYAPLPDVVDHRRSR